MNNVSIAGIGGANDGRNYYIAHSSAPTNSPVVRNSQLGGQPSNRYVHAINTGVNKCEHHYSKLRMQLPE
jgi:hypothetical protein